MPSAFTAGSARKLSADRWANSSTSIQQKFKEIIALTTECGEWSGELAHVAKDKQELVIESRWSLLRDRDGQPKSILAINTDVSELRRIEVQFMRAQRMESLGILAGGIAHDLNNILTPIMLSIDMLKHTAVDPHTRSIIETIEISARRGSDIVQQVLSFARGMEGQRIVIQPKYLLKDIEHIVTDTFPSDIRLQLSLPHDTWTILGDPTQVQQVLLNLCVNARDAMPNGGTLSISAENCLADAQYVAMNLQAKQGCYVAIAVTDVGVGISPDIMAKIFEPFFTTKEVGQGDRPRAFVGEGDREEPRRLHQCLQRGRARDDVQGLPARAIDAGRYVRGEAAGGGNAAARRRRDDPGHRRREPRSLSITSETLQSYGYNVLTASNGAEGVAIYAHEAEEDRHRADRSFHAGDGRPRDDLRDLEDQPEGEDHRHERHGRSRKRGEGVHRRHQAFHQQALHRGHAAEDAEDHREGVRGFA